MLRPILTEKAWDNLIKILRDIGCYVTDNLRGSVEGILWRIRTGSPWRDVPENFGNWNSIYKLYSRWNFTGKLDAILESVEGKIDYRTAYIDGSYVSVHQHASGAHKEKESAIGTSRAGETTKIHAVCGRKGNPVLIEITAGDVSDITQADKMKDDLVAVFSELVADKAYDSDAFRIDLMEEGCIPCIPTKSNSTRKNPGFHKSKYKKRHRVENLFARLKHFRGIATRYDKLKTMYAGSVKIGLICFWLGLRV